MQATSDRDFGFGVDLSYREPTVTVKREHEVPSQHKEFLQSLLSKI